MEGGREGGRGLEGVRKGGSEDLEREGWMEVEGS